MVKYAASPFETSMLPGPVMVGRMRPRSRTRTIAMALAIAVTAGAALAQRALAVRPGYSGGGVTLLPNGWRIAPAGRHLSIGDLPLALTIAPDGRSLIVTNNGYARPTLRVVDLDRRVVVQTFGLDDAWLGLAWHPDGKRLYSSGAAANSVVELRWQNGRVAAGSTIQLAPSSRTPPAAAAEVAPNAAKPGPQ